MRLGLDLGEMLDLDRARQADELGLWAITVSATPGGEMVRAARVVEQTQYLRVIVKVDLDTEHPLTIAEELSVLDNLSGGRIAAIVTGNPQPETLVHFREVLIGRPKDRVVMAPPPVQTELSIWLASPTPTRGPPVVASSPAEIVINSGEVSPGTAGLSADLDRDRAAIDTWRDAGCTHLLVTWPGPVKVLARHLVTRAATGEFPSVVADLADQLDPIRPEPD